jgi:hypothetical protein
MGTGIFSEGVKRPESDVDHSSPSFALVKNEWSYTSTLSYALFYHFKIFSKRRTLYMKKKFSSWCKKVVS